MGVLGYKQLTITAEHAEKKDALPYYQRSASDILWLIYSDSNLSIQT